LKEREGEGEFVSSKTEIVKKSLRNENGDLNHLFPV